MNVIGQALNSVLPVFLLISLGALLRRVGVLRGAAQRGAIKLCYYIGLPALLFSSLSEAALPGRQAGAVFLMVLAGMGGVLVVGLAVGRATGIPSRTLSSLLHCGYRGNCVYIGLPVLLFAMQARGGEAQVQQASQLAALSIGLIFPLYNIVGVVLLLLGRQEFRLAAVGGILKGIARNPLLLGCLAGFAWSMTGLDKPFALDRTVTTLGQFALPLALLSIGAAMAGGKLHGRLHLTGLAVGLKLVVSPAVGLLAARAMHLGPLETTAGMVFLATPTAIATYIMAGELDGDCDLTANAVILSTLLSVISLGLTIGLSAG
jgi:hypothetical protein